jgi:hypothetical protein
MKRVIGKDWRRALAGLTRRRAAPLRHPAETALISREGIAVAWAASTPNRPYANLGDALSPVIIAALSRLPVVRRDFDYPGPRLAAVGTIGHAQRNGTVHFWGTGMDGSINPACPKRGYSRPANTEFRIHAVRGPYTGQILRREGMAVPAAYGDPVWFLPKLFAAKVPAEYELGVVLHISEIEEYTPAARARPIYRRYQVPKALGASIRIINTVTETSVAALEAKVRDMLGCRRIASTSLHGLVIAEAYGIPCTWFAPRPGSGQIVGIDDDAAGLDHRVRDFYAGAGARTLPIFAQSRDRDTVWDRLIEWIDRHWTPLDYDPTALFDAYPLIKAVSLDEDSWPLDQAITARIAL